MLKGIKFSHLSRAGFKVFLQHTEFHDITGVPDDCHDGNRVTAPDVAVDTLSAVETKRSRHPKPCLTHTHTKFQHNKLTVYNNVLKIRNTFSVRIQRVF